MDDLTLRDYFAAKAMQGMLANNLDEDLGPSFEKVVEHYANASYAYADAMMRARQS